MLKVKIWGEVGAGGTVLAYCREISHLSVIENANTFPRRSLSSNIACGFVVDCFAFVFAIWSLS